MPTATNSPPLSSPLSPPTTEIENLTPLPTRPVGPKCGDCWLVPVPGALDIELRVTGWTSDENNAPTAGKATRVDMENLRSHMCLLKFDMSI